MIRRRTIASLLAVGALGVGGIAAGCGDDDSGGGDVGELKVGVLVPLTGGLGPFGGPGAQAAELGAAQVNAAAGDTGLSMTLVQEDTKSDPQAAAEAATKLVESDGVTAIAGPWGTDEVTTAAENVTVPGGIPLVSPSATQPAITDLDDDGLVFRTPPSDAIQGRVLAQLVARELGPDATLNTGGRNDSYGTALVEEFTTAWEAGGGTVAKNVPYNPQAASVNSEAQQLASGNPDGWMIIDYADDWAKMGPALVRTGNWDPGLTFTGDGLKSSTLPQRIGKPATEGMRATAPTSADAPAGEQFDALWNAEVGEDRQTYDAQNFDAVILIALAAAAGGSSDPASIAENLQAVSGPPGDKYTFENLQEALAAAADGEDIDYEGASGPIDFDDAGDPTSAAYGTWSYRNGQLQESDAVFERVTSQ
jgi:ABC-type branched-subunit amino acid transport system substrate-binding protein